MSALCIIIRPCAYGTSVVYGLDVMALSQVDRGGIGVVRVNCQVDGI